MRHLDADQVGGPAEQIFVIFDEDLAKPGSVGTASATM